jgi:hypothetical protein
METIIMSDKNNYYDWKKLIGASVVFKGQEATLEQKVDGNWPFCLKDKKQGVLIEFYEEVIIDAYKGKSDTFYFVDDNGNKNTNFLRRDVK